MSSRFSLIPATDKEKFDSGISIAIVGMLLSWQTLCRMLRLSLVVAAARLGRSLVPAMMQTRWGWCTARAAARPGEMQPSTSSHSA